MGSRLRGYREHGRTASIGNFNVAVTIDQGEFLDIARAVTHLVDKRRSSKTRCCKSKYDSGILF